MLFKALHCGTLISIGFCFLLCVLAKCVFAVSGCVWVRNAVEILRGDCCLFFFFPDHLSVFILVINQLDAQNFVLH